MEMSELMTTGFKLAMNDENKKTLASYVDIYYHNSLNWNYTRWIWNSPFQLLRSESPLLRFSIFAFEPFVKLLSFVTFFRQKKLSRFFPFEEFRKRKSNQFARQQFSKFHSWRNRIVLHSLLVFNGSIESIWGQPLEFSAKTPGNCSTDQCVEPVAGKLIGGCLPH